MFRGLLDNLHKAYKGNEIYIPDAIYPLISEWYKSTFTIVSLVAGRMPVLEYNGKKLIPYDETAVSKSYQSCPIHVPDRILEKSIIIESSLVEYVEPIREEKKEEIVEKVVPARKIIKQKKVRFV